MEAGPRCCLQEQDMASDKNPESLNKTVILAMPHHPTLLLHCGSKWSTSGFPILICFVYTSLATYVNCKFN